MSNNDNFIKQYNNEIYSKTKKYQKIYSKYKLPNNENIFKDEKFSSFISTI